MKTPEQIAEECINNLQKSWKLVWWNTCAPEPESFVVVAINEAIQQERERTCEWVDEAWGYKTGCGKRIYTNSAVQLNPFPCCPSCGGKIVVKKEANETA